MVSLVMPLHGSVDSLDLSERAEPDRASSGTRPSGRLREEPEAFSQLLEGGQVAVEVVPGRQAPGPQPVLPAAQNAPAGPAAPRPGLSPDSTDRLLKAPAANPSRPWSSRKRGYRSRPRGIEAWSSEHGGRQGSLKPLTPQPPPDRRWVHPGALEGVLFTQVLPHPVIGQHCLHDTHNGAVDCPLKIPIHLARL